MIAGIEPVTSGTMRFGSRVANDLAPRDRIIARQVVLGVRPQDLVLVGGQEPASLRGRVWVVELERSEKVVEVEYGG